MHCKALSNGFQGKYQYFYDWHSPLSDTVEVRTKFLVIDELSRQLPFNKKPEAINLKRQTTKLRQYMTGKFCQTQVGLYNLPWDCLKLSYEVGTIV